MVRMVLRIAVLVLSLGFLFVAYVGFVRPERLAEALALSPTAPHGLGAIRALVGGQYLAMGGVAIFAVTRGPATWLAPLAAIEGCMVVARVVSLLSGASGPTGPTTIVLESVSCLVLALGAVLLSQPRR